MKNKIAIIANGSVNNHNMHKEMLKQFNIIICADGGANISRTLEITPNYIIGDMDSIHDSNLTYFKEKNKTKIIKDLNQNKTDLELAISLAQSLDPSEIIIFGAIGNRIDHTLSNILCLIKIKKHIKSMIVDDKNTIELIDKNTEIIEGKNDLISVIPLSDVSKLNYTGLKWNVNNINTKSGWFGISNEILEEKATINFSSGKILLIRVRK
jgi:thiamine pyrophosphokinase